MKYSVLQISSFSPSEGWPGGQQQRLAGHTGSQVGTLILICLLFFLLYKLEGWVIWFHSRTLLGWQEYIRFPVLDNNW